MRGLKKFFVSVFLCCSYAGFGQVDSIVQAETTRNQPAVILPEKPAPVKKRMADTSQYQYADSVLRSQRARQQGFYATACWPILSEKLL
jgi:hypothetical protein